MTTQLFTHTFKGSGRTVSLERVSPLLVAKLKKSMRPPAPPTEDVPRPDGTVEKVSNPAHPDYAATLESWQLERETALREFYIRHSLRHRFTEEDKIEIEHMRADAALSGIDLSSETDEFVFVSYICVRTPTDYQEFIAAVQGISEVDDPKLKAGSTTTT